MCMIPVMSCSSPSEPHFRRTLGYRGCTRSTRVHLDARPIRYVPPHTPYSSLSAFFLTSNNTRPISSAVGNTGAFRLSVSSTPKKLAARARPAAFGSTSTSVISATGSVASGSMVLLLLLGADTGSLGPVAAFRLLFPFLGVGTGAASSDGRGLLSGGDGALD